MKFNNKSFVFTAILIFLPIIFTLIACTGGNDEIKAIRDRGILRVGVKVDVPRFGYSNPETGEMEGVEIDIARAIAKDILGSEKAIRFVNITAQTRGPMLDNGEIDLVIATFTITEERKKLFNFSRSYFSDELGYLVRKNSLITRPEDLDGKNVGLVQASTAKTAFDNEYKQLGINVTVNEFVSYPEVKAALIYEMVDAFVTDKSILYGYLDEDSVLLEAGFNPQQYGIACKLGNNKLAGRIESLLDTMEKNGELSVLFKKWGL